MATGTPGAQRSGTRVRADRDLFEVPCLSLADVYYRHRPFVLWLIRARLKGGACPALVEDIFQGVFVKLARRIRAAHDVVPHPVKKELEHLVYDEVRVQSRSQARRRVDGEPDDERMPASKPDPEQELALCEDRLAKRRLVQAVFDRMRPEASALIRMIDLDGVPHEEAAERIGCPLSALHCRLRRARESFRETLFDLRRVA